MEKTLEQANAELLERRQRLLAGRTKGETLEPLENSLNIFNFKMPTPEQAAKAAAQADAMEKEYREAEEAREKERAADAIRRRFERALVPARHSDRTIDPHPEWQRTFDVLKTNLRRGFLVALLGNRGTGKTQLAVEAIRFVVKEGGDARYVKAMDLIIRIRESFRKDGPSERQVIDEFLKPDLLVIDAMEERGETEFEDRMLSHLMDLRYDACLDTILISNQTREAFGQAIGKSAVSRLHETGKVFECNWPSFRKAPAAPETTQANGALPEGDR